MSTAQLYQQCRQTGLVIKTDGEQLFCSPRDRLTNELRESLREHKAELIELLQDRLSSCPLLKAKLLCHAHGAGRCNHDPETCNIANGMKDYIERRYVA